MIFALMLPGAPSGGIQVSISFENHPETVDNGKGESPRKRDRKQMPGSGRGNRKSMYINSGGKGNAGRKMRGRNKTETDCNKNCIVFQEL